MNGGVVAMTLQEPNKTAEYLATMCDQLAALAERDGLKVGAYLLKMAQLEFAGLVETPVTTTQASR
jgi:hypothetical protein